MKADCGVCVCLTESLASYVAKILGESGLTCVFVVCFLLLMEEKKKVVCARSCLEILEPHRPLDFENGRYDLRLARLISCHVNPKPTAHDFVNRTVCLNLPHMRTIFRS